ncbi:MAG: hypothetical protein KJO50_08485, partial [Bacteroidia bacterium]|nr:hypothetical protein [Bacteroidia bacterium]
CAITDYPVYTSFIELDDDGGSGNDNCELDESTFLYLGQVSDGNSCPEVYTRTYQVSDLCGNSTTCTHEIRIDDTVKPPITCHPTQVAVCSIEEYPAYMSVTEFTDAGGILTDNCQIDSMGLVLLQQTNNDNCPITYTRKYQISDLCGNIEDCTQEIDITEDFIDPSLTCPPDTSTLCDINDLLPYMSLAEFISFGGNASDNCVIDSLSFNLQNQSSDGGTCPRTYTRNYEVEDQCGNAATCIQVVVVNDTIAPLMICPDTASTICAPIDTDPFSNFGEFTSGGGSATDPCGIVTGSFSLVSETITAEEIIQEYTISDDCGNASTCIYVISSAADTQKPNMTCPDDLEADCDISEHPPYPDYAAFLAAPNASVTDNCDLDINSFMLISEVDNGVICPRIVTRTYQIADEFGNLGTCQQLITISETIDPVLTCPPDFTVSVCDIIEEPAYLTLDELIVDGGSASDNCQLDTMTFILVSETSNNSDCPETVTRTYRIDDLCGNFDECTHKVTAYESVLPMITCPDTIYANCDKNEQAKYDNLSEFLAAGGTVSDNCEIDPSSFNDAGESNDGMTCPKTYTRSYRIRDICDNEATCDQTLIVIDTIAPVIGCPPMMTKECSLDQFKNPETQWYKYLENGGSGSDECDLDTLTFTFVSDISDGMTCPETYFRTYKIEDLCGNTATCQQELIINDLKDPNLNCPGDKSVQCSIDQYPPYASFMELDDDGGSGGDNCEIDESTFLFLGEVSDGISCPETYLRTYQVSDFCGNTKTCTHEIEIDDTQIPVITCPSNLNGTCDISEFPPYADVISFTSAGGIITDNCDIDTSSFVLLSETSNTTCIYTYTRKYQITDLCGNIEDCTQ